MMETNESRDSGGASLNGAGAAFARSLISSGHVSDGSWSFSAADGDALLGESGDDWAAYGKCHLATSSDGDAGTKAHYKYPFAKKVGGTITLFKSALNAIRSRASQQGATGVFDAAGKLLDSLDSKDKKEEKSIALGDREFRYEIGDIELRTTTPDSNGPGTLVGYSARFNTLSNDLGGFRERIEPGAFCDALRCDVRALTNHDPGWLLGRNRSGTLRMMEDDQGLKVEIDLPDTQAGRDTAEMVRRGDITGMSFGFDAKGGDSWDRSTNPPTRTLRSVKTLHDVGPVTFPAYTDTSVALRSLNQINEAEKAELNRQQELKLLSLAKARQWLAEASLLPEG